MPTDDLKNPGLEEVYTPQELGRAKKLHPSKIRELFRDEEGVIRFGRASTTKRRGYLTLRIPKKVADRVFARMTVGSGMDA